MSGSSKFNSRQIVIISVMIIGFLGFAVMPLVNLFNGFNNGSSVPQTSRVTKEDLLKKLGEQEKSYQKILEREPKNAFALQKVVDARLKIYQINGDVTMLQKSLAPLSELIRQNPKNPTLVALKRQIQLMADREGKKPAH